MSGDSDSRDDAPRKKRRRRRRPRGRSRRPAPDEPRDSPASVEQLAETALHSLRELAHGIAQRRGVNRRDAGEALGWLTTRLSVDADTAADKRVERDSVRTLIDHLDQLVDERLRAAIAFRQGHVYDFLTDTPDGPHTRPAQPDATFRGYTPTGRPVWQSFTNLCLERQLERVDRLYANPPEIIALVQTGRELTEGLLPGFGGEGLAYNVLGQVVAGLIPASLDPRDRDSPRIALTIQLVETRTGKAGRRLRTNLIGLTTDQIVQAAASGAARGPAERLRRLVRATRHRLEDLGRKTARKERRGAPAAAPLQEQVLPLLSQLRGDMERLFRPVQRRTQHAQERHLDGERPTSDAMRDAATAGEEHILRDTERKTLIVLGPRGRAHVFTDAGRHVTSLRLARGELERKLERGRWARAEPSDVAAFRRALAGPV